MPNDPLRKCPTCRQPLTDVIRKGMGLRNGETLNSLCPDNIGPSDIDHLLNNDESSGFFTRNGKVLAGTCDHTAFLEYKPANLTLNGGQQRVANSLTGNWVELETGRHHQIRHFTLPQYPDSPEQEADLMAEVVRWVWHGHFSALHPRLMLP